MENYFDLLEQQDNLAYAMTFPEEFTDVQYSNFERRYQELNDQIAAAYRTYEMELE